MVDHRAPQSLVNGLLRLLHTQLLPAAGNCPEGYMWAVRKLLGTLDPGGKGENARLPGALHSAS